MVDIFISKNNLYYSSSTSFITYVPIKSTS